MRLESTVKYLYWLLAAFFVTTTIIGGVRQFSPVPFFDIWNGAIEFYLKFEETHDWRLWWAQHNEHRILLAKSLFWLDLKFFKGTGIFLVIANYAFLGAIVALFCQILREAKHLELKCAAPFCIAWLVSWMQNENLTWGFQVQFWMAQLFPLLAFYFYYKSLQDSGFGYFVTSLLCAILAVGSMANGILVAPLLLVYAAYSRSGWRKCSAITTVGIIELLLYFSAYSTPEHHGSLKSALYSNPIGVAHYAFLYLGSPFAAILGNTGFAKATGTGFGALFVMIVVITCFIKIKERIEVNGKGSIADPLMCYILYLLATAIGTAGGRIIFGVDQSLSSRYATPVLMGWMALFIVVYPNVVQRANPKAVTLGLLSLLVAMVPIQVRALTAPNTVKFDRSVAALAIAFNIKDVNQLNNLWPLTDEMLEIAKKAKENRITVFAQNPLSELEGNLGSYVAVDANKACSGYLDSKEYLRDNEKWLKVSGWFYSAQEPHYVWITDQKLNAIGLAVTGSPRLDVTSTLHIKDENTGFTGYANLTSVNEATYLVSMTDGCAVNIRQ